MPKTSAALAALLLAAAAGCSDTRYEHKRLGSESEPFRAVSKMIERLRAAGDEGFEALADAQTAPGLDEARRAGVIATLGQLARSREVRLVRVDQWGDDMYRATMEFASPSGTRTAALLLVAEEDRLLWAGTN